MEHGLPRHSYGVINGHSFDDVLSIEKPSRHIRNTEPELLEVVDLQPVWLARHDVTDFTLANEHETDDLPGVLAITVNEEEIVSNFFRAVLKDYLLAVVFSKRIKGAEMPMPIVAESILPKFQRLHHAA